MAKIDKNFDFLNLDRSTKFVIQEKNKNINVNIAYMLNKSNIMFLWHDLPETIPFKELEKLLQVNGFAIIGKINGELYAMNGGLGGELDIYDKPTIATVSIPYFNFNATWEIGKDCIVIYNDSMCMGLVPIYAKYCTMITENEISLVMCDINKRLQTLISANDDNTIESAKAFIKDITDGRFSVIAESKLFDSLKVNPTTNANSNSVQDLIEYNRYLKASLYNEIGLNANTNLKRERLLESEIETNSDSIYPFVDNMLSCRNDGIKALTELFGVSATVEYNSSWDYRIYNGKSIHNTETEIELSETGNETGNETLNETGNETENENVDNIVDNVDNTDNADETESEDIEESESTDSDESELENNDNADENSESDNNETDSDEK